VLKARFNWQGVRTGAGTESRFQRWLYCTVKSWDAALGCWLNMLRLQH